MPFPLWSRHKSRRDATSKPSSQTESAVSVKNEPMPPASSYHRGSPPQRPSSPAPSYTQLPQGRMMVDHIWRGNFLNQRYSRLMGLPDHLLVKIMSYVHLQDLVQLRYISRTFLRLFSVHETFRPLHLMPEQSRRRFEYTARLWAVPRALPLEPLPPFYFETSVCLECLRKGNGEILEQEIYATTLVRLYCSACGTQHRALHFSAIQRKEKRDSRRVCMGHERRFQICAHKSISLGDAESRAASTFRNQLTCSHAHAEGRPRCNAKKCPADNQPHVRFYRNEKQELRIEISFASHIRVKRLPNGKICPVELRQELILSNQHDVVAEWYRMLCRTGSDEMRAFDPNLCDCVDYYGGSPILESECPIHLCPTSFTRWQERVPDGGHVSLTGRCAYARHGFTVDKSGISLRVDFLRCADGGRNDMLGLRKTLDCLVDPDVPFCSGWADLVLWGCYDEDADKEEQVTCQKVGCATRSLQWLDLHLRPTEVKLMRRRSCREPWSTHRFLQRPTTTRL